MITAPRGMSLIELLVALPLIALLGVLAVTLLLTVQRDALRLDGTLNASRELRHSAGILLSDLRVARSEDVIAWTDTALEFESTVGTGVVCAATYPVTFVAVPEASASATNFRATPDPAEALWNSTPQAGDRVHLWRAGTTAFDQDVGATANIQTITNGTDCDRSPLRSPGTRETTRLTLRDTIGGRVAVGAPVRITRRTRYSLYRASDGDWFLGRRTLGVAGWDVIQPVAGPLAASRDRGLLIAVVDSAGNALASGTGRPLSVSLALRAPRQTGRGSAGRAAIDSTRITIALRSARSDAR